jgi:hypothetical protein
MKAFGGRLYRPDVAPADAPVENYPAPTDVKLPPATDGPVDVTISNPLFESAAPRRK